MVKNPQRLIHTHAARGEERVVIRRLRVAQGSLDDRNGFFVGSGILVTGCLLEESLRNGFSNLGIAMAGQLDKDIKRRGLLFGVGH